MKLPERNFIMFLKTNLGYLFQIALKNMQLLVLICEKWFQCLTAQWQHEKPGKVKCVVRDILLFSEVITVWSNTRDEYFILFLGIKLFNVSQPRTQGRLWASFSVLVSEAYPGTGGGFKQSDWLFFLFTKVSKLLPTTSGSEKLR